MRLFAILHRFPSPGLVQLGATRGLQRSSCSTLQNPELTFFRMLFSTVMSSTTAELPLSDVRTVNSREQPFCAFCQAFSKMLPVTTTRWAFLNSKLFLTDHLAEPFVV